MSQQVDAIMQQINQLNDADRLALEQRLLEKAESEWQREARLARAQAAERKIDLQTIDDAVNASRYGS